MVIYEFRDSAYDHAFELMDKAKESAKKTKLTLCELEDAMYECYEASKEDHEDEYEEYPEMDFRGRKSYRHDEHYGVREEEEDDDKDIDMRYRRMNRRRSSMRRNRMGRFA
jgi:hypothetical protein